jgi:hypothetical protein
LDLGGSLKPGACRFGQRLLEQEAPRPAMMYSLATVLTTAPCVSRKAVWPQSPRSNAKDLRDAREEPDKVGLFRPPGTSLPGQARRSHPLFQFPTEG